MSGPNKPAAYYQGCNEALLRAVPASARRILDVGCGEGVLGVRLKEADPGRTIMGIEREPDVAARAGRHLDRVFCLDAEAEDPPLEPGSLDCVLYGDVLDEWHDPGTVLDRHRCLLAPGGCIVCSVPNAQHHSLVAALLRSDFQYTGAGLLDASHLRFFTYSTLIKLLLDAGFAPDLVDAVRVPCPPEFLAAAVPLLNYLGLDPSRTARYLSAYQYIVRGTPLPPADGRQDTDARGRERPLSFVVCVSSEPILTANFLASPCLGPGSPHQVLLMRGCRSAAEGLQRGLTQARNAVVVWTHQDVYLPRGWPARFVEQYRLVGEAFGTPGVVGVYGVARRGMAVLRAGRIVDRDHLLQEPIPLPAAVDALDEVLLALPRDTPLAADPRLGFHLYGADLCLAARKRGLPVVTVNALCFHNSLTADIPAAFHASAEALAAKWPDELPIATSCAMIGAG